MASGIYVVEHRESGKRYVGRSSDIANRWALHRRDAERGRNNSPFHRALRKYGFDAFNWRVVVTAPERLHVTLERQFMLDWETYAPLGYNVGDAQNGMPSRRMLELLGPDERARYEVAYQLNSKKMHASLAEKRKDPQYEAAYLKIKKDVALKREADRKIRLLNDPEYAAKEAKRRRLGGVKAAAAKKAREEADPAYGEAARKARSEKSKAARAARFWSSRKRKV